MTCQNIHQQNLYLELNTIQVQKSPNEGERIDKGYSVAWLHHKGRNKHHFEYWMDYSNVTHRNDPVEMPYNYVVEMFCDRVAASKIYNGSYIRKLIL